MDISNILKPVLVVFTDFLKNYTWQTLLFLLFLSVTLNVWLYLSHSKPQPNPSLIPSPTPSHLRSSYASISDSLLKKDILPALKTAKENYSHDVDRYLSTYVKALEALHIYILKAKQLEESYGKSAPSSSAEYNQFVQELKEAYPQITQD